MNERATTPDQLRELLQEAVLADLLGPANGENEIVQERYVRDRYLIGKLGPMGQSLLPGTLDTDDWESDGNGSEDGSGDARPPRAPAMHPSSLGMSFVVEDTATQLRLHVKWGRYQRIDQKAEEAETAVETPKRKASARVWQRIPMASTLDLPLVEGKLAAQKPAPIDQPDIFIDGLVRRRSNGESDEWHVTLFLINGQREPRDNSDAAWIFQPELTVTAPDGKAIFVRRHPAPERLADPELRLMAMRYRGEVEFAVGHGVAVQAILAADDPLRAIALKTTIAPRYDVLQTVAYEPEGLSLDMRQLAAIPDGGFRTALNPLLLAYAAWIERLATRIANPTDDLRPYLAEAEASLAQCRRTLQRIDDGIQLLDRNQQAAAAFRFANRAMADQRVRSIYAARVRQGQSIDLESIEAQPWNHSWRTFQLAFLLLNLPSLSDPTHPERGEMVDLLWFPTGGGKTEAYLGVAAFTLAIRRLQGEIGNRSGHAGVAVLMRYTLRLLTLQQFQRAAALICACEVIRRESPTTWGNEPFRLGLWVGANSTPNYTKDAAEAVVDMRSGRSPSRGTPHQLTNCPWCGKPIKPGSDIEADLDQLRTFVYCGDSNGDCDFCRAKSPNEGLPVITVDEEIYRRLPALLIATVDKFAQMPWNGRIAMLFGQVDGYCTRHGYRSPEIEDNNTHPARGRLPKARTIPSPLLRPPDLIIQDELHLISGPLGTMVGLYEAAVDRLCTWQLGDKQVTPKIIASTATIRRAEQQVRGVFARQVNIFPAQGLDAGDTFFAHQVPTTQKWGRRYLGIYAPGVRYKTTLIRTFTAYLAAAQYLFGVDSYDKDADPWMTLVGYFNSLRELGGMKRAVDDSITTRLRAMGDAGRPRLASRRLNYYTIKELTSRLSAADIPEILDQLEKQFTQLSTQPTAKSADQTGARIDKPAIDVLLATNMISVGVDVARLGLMIVAGQPKNSAEYIQATSRVGRSSPGLVCTVYNWTRPRDISHYERFHHYHATFYQHVEALSVTPFAPRALDRGLTAAYVANVRLASSELNANQRAATFQRNHLLARQATDALIARASRVAGEQRVNEVASRVEMRIDQWEQTIQRSRGAQLGYSDSRADGGVEGLLRVPDSNGWELFTCMNSLRNVESSVNLILNEEGFDTGWEQSWRSAQDRDGNAQAADSDGVELPELDDEGLQPLSEGGDNESSN